MDKFRHIVSIVGLVIFLFWLFVTAGCLTIMPIVLICRMIQTVGFDICGCMKIIGLSILCSFVSALGAIFGIMIGIVFKNLNY